MPDKSSNSGFRILSKFGLSDAATRERRFRDKDRDPLLDGGTNYQCTHEDLLSCRSSVLESAMLGPRTPPYFTTLDRATEWLEKSLAQPAETIEGPALTRLDRFFNAPENDNWCPDIIYKAFADLDLLFFKGELRGNVQLGWTRPEEDQNQTWWAFTAAASNFPGTIVPGKAIIKLSSRGLLLETPGMTVRCVIKFLLLEMIHAYLSNAAYIGEDRNEKLWWNALEGDDWKEFQKQHFKNPSNGHGSHFIRLENAIDDRSIRLGLPFNMRYSDIFDDPEAKRMQTKWLKANSDWLLHNLMNRPVWKNISLDSIKSSNKL